MNKAKIFKASIMILMGLPNALAAEQWSVAPFALYEQAQEKIVVDGVSTKYGLGVLGGQITYQGDQNLSLTARAGYGQNNDQEVSFSGAQFKGKVTGTYFEASATTNLLTYSKSIISLEGSYSKRDLKADDLIGSRNGLALTGNSTSSIASTDVLVNLRHNMTDKVTASASLGYGTWNMKADATAYFSSGGIRANANKKIDTTGYDPIYKFGVNYEGERANLSVNISNRSLRSKSNTEITSGEVVLNFKF